MELILPVTPESFEVSHGISVETVNMVTLGEVNIAGNGTLCSFQVECLLPARPYHFLQQGAVARPVYYIETLENWCDEKSVLRFIVSDTINVPVLIEDIRYGEKDGTGDVNATISLRKYRELSAVRTSTTQNSNRSTNVSNVNKTMLYQIKHGDTLSAICRKYYNNSSLYSKLAKYNGIKNPNLIIAGKTLKIPPKNLL